MGILTTTANAVKAINQQIKPIVNQAIQQAAAQPAQPTQTTQPATQAYQQQQQAIASNLATAQPALLAAPQQGVAANAGTGNMIQQDQQLGTVEGRTASIIDKNSPLMQRAAAKAIEQANARGLRNSSMAIGSAQNAVIEAAAPIAAQDARSFTDIQRANQNAANSFAQFNASNQQQANLFNAGEANRVNIEQAKIEQQTNLANMQQQNQLVFNQLDQANKERIANIEAAYKNEMQSNVTASSLFHDAINSLALIQKDTTMNAATKQQNINQVLAMLRNGLDVSGSIANLNLGAVLDFSGVA